MELQTSQPAGEAAAIIEATRETAPPTPLDDEQTLWLAHESQTLIDIGVDLDMREPHPRRQKGVFIARTGYAFASLIAMQADGEGGLVPVYVDRLNIDQPMVAVLNGGDARSPGWADHRIALKPRLHPTFETWRTASGVWSDQKVMADFIESWRHVIIEPDGAEMLEVAQTLEASTSTAFKSSHRLANGERKLVYDEETSAKGGAAGDLTVPESFTILAPVFDGGGAMRRSGRFRYQIGSGVLKMMVKIDAIDDLLATAVAALVDDAAAALGGLDIDHEFIEGVAP